MDWQLVVKHTRCLNFFFFCHQFLEIPRNLFIILDFLVIIDRKIILFWISNLGATLFSVENSSNCWTTRVRSLCCLVRPGFMKRTSESGKPESCRGTPKTYEKHGRYRCPRKYTNSRSANQPGPSISNVQDYSYLQIWVTLKYGVLESTCWHDEIRGFWHVSCLFSEVPPKWKLRPSSNDVKDLQLPRRGPGIFPSPTAHV